MISKKFFINQASELTKKWIRHNVSFKSIHRFLEYAKILDHSLARLPGGGGGGRVLNLY